MVLQRLAPVIFVLLWSTGWVVAKYASFYADPLTFLALRYAVAAILFYAVCRFSGVRWPRSRQATGHAMVSGIFLHGLYLGMVWWAIGHGVPAALSGIIAGLQPLMTAVAAGLLIGEMLTRLQRLGLILGFCGIAIAVLPNVLTLDASAIPAGPIAVNVLAMVCVTVGTLYQKRFLREGDLRAVATLQYVGALAITLPAAFALEEMRLDYGLPLFLILGWSVLGISMGAVALLLLLIRRGDVSKAASMTYLVPPLAAIEASFLFGETLTLPMIVGTVIVVVGVYLTNRKEVVKAA
ncbi:DMT family transporter [Peteryoungia desertarenae]|uniref:DMT family transporter n=1 Tax=Peteryoungia desertarenae TaxID=1813451 RepID=A0ABX6QIB8_9HYPH|nr:DMT family transporter [Peteryoungia desertarenae]QLF68309.1 DMT family transporter [Peteryoungia desertarenae]